MIISRRKPRKYKGAHPVEKKKTRRELKPVERAFCVGAAIAGGASLDEVLELFSNNLTKSGLSRLLKRVKEKAKDTDLPISDPIFYENELGRGRKELLSSEQKNQIINLTASSRNHREKEAWQAIADGDYDEIIPKMSISTFENVMYEAGFARRKPGWKPKLSASEEARRYRWALDHNPDKYAYGDNLGFNFRLVAYSDETPARVGEQCGMQRAWFRDGERYDEDVKKDRVQKYSQLQFYGIFTYNHKGPCIIFERETPLEKSINDMLLGAENEERRAIATSAQTRSRAALNLMNESDINGRATPRKSQYTKKDDYTRGLKSRGGIDGFRHREETLKRIVPWLKSLPTTPILLEDGVPAHSSRIANDYLTTEQVDKLSWPGHSPDINASEHAWPWTRRHITKDFYPSNTAEECKQQWKYEWERMPQEVINKWIDAIPDVVRKIILHGGKNDFHDGGG
jgi:hypothetical protein